MGLTTEQVLAWLIENDSVEEGEVQHDTLLFSSGIVDSFDMVDLVAWIEETAGITFGPLDLNLDNLDSADRILAFVNAKSA